MLQFIRDKTRGVVTWIIIIVICMTFLFWGISNYFITTSHPNKIAEVNGQTITYTDFKQRYEQLLEQQSILGDPLSSLEQQQLPAIALHQLIQLRLLAQAAESQGFVITDKEILAMLAQLPELQEDGVFKPERLQRILYDLKVTQSQFLKSLQQKMLVAQVQTSLLASSFVLPSELKRYDMLYRQQRDAEIVIIPSALFFEKVSDANLTEEGIQAFYQAHLQAFGEPAKLRLNYVILAPDAPDFIHKSDQLMVLNEESPDTLDRIAADLQLPIQTTPFFTEQGSSKTLLTQNAKILKTAFSEALIEQRLNSDVITLESGALVVIRVADYQPAHSKPLSMVKPMIIQTLKQQEARKQAYLAGQSLVSTVALKKPLAYVAKQSGYQYFTRLKLSRETTDLPQQILQSIFRLPNQPLPQHQVIQLDNGDVAVIQLNAVHQASSKGSLNQELAQRLTANFGRMDEEWYRMVVSLNSRVKRYPLPPQFRDNPDSV